MVHKSGENVENKWGTEATHGLRDYG